MRLFTITTVGMTSLIWTAGSLSFWSISDDDRLLWISLFFVAYLIIVGIFSARFKGEEIRQAPHNDALAFAVVMNSGGMMIGAVIMFLAIRKAGAIYGFDDARFLVRSWPFFGFLSRVQYWWPIAMAPLTVFVYLSNRKRAGIFSLIAGALAGLSSGSKAGVVWFMIALLVSLEVFANTNSPSYKQLKRILLTALCLSVALMAGLFLLFSEDVESAFGGFLFRMGFGAIEGISYVLQYLDLNGPSFPHFTFQRPVESILQSFRLIDKDYFSGDTGVYLARYFARDNDNAGYTISAPGWIMLELGEWGLPIGLLVCVMVSRFIIGRMYKAPYLLSKSFYVGMYIMLAHFLDWGFVDGILIFAFIYVLLFYASLFFFGYLYLFLSDRFSPLAEGPT